MEEEISKKILREIIANEVLREKDENDTSYMLTSNNSNWIFDFRNAFLKPQYLDIFAKFFWQEMGSLYPFQVWGLEMGVIPLLSAITLEWLKRWTPVNAFIVRKERKETGLWNKIEWEVSDVPIILIDDLFNSGNSFLKIVASLKSINKKASYFFAFIHFGNPVGIERLIENEIFIKYPFTLSDFWLKKGNEERKFSSINPKTKCLYAARNPNRFLIVPKSNPIIYDKLIICWGEGWAIAWIERDTGYILWNFQTGYHSKHKSILSSPIIVDEKIIFWAYDGNLYALNAGNGELQWKNAVADYIGSSPSYSRKHSLIYIGTEHASENRKWWLLAVDANSGDSIWFQDFSDFVHCSPWYSSIHDIVLCWSNSNRIIACDGATGDILWEMITEGEIKWWFWLSPDEEITYVGAWDGYIYALHTKTGELAWKFKTDNIIYATPLITEEGIFFWSYDKYFYHLGFDGECLQKIKTGGKIACQASTIKENIICFWSNDGLIYFYDTKNMRVITTLIHDERISTRVIYTNPKLYFYDHMNRLFEIQNINPYIC